MSPTEAEWAYLAGIIDGEGCISTRLIKGRSPNPRIYVTQRDPRLVPWLVAKFGGRQNKQGIYSRWSVTTTAQVGKILEGVLPYLVMKKDQALLGIEACSLSSLPMNRRFEIHHQLQLLHRRKGVV